MLSIRRRQQFYQHLAERHTTDNKHSILAIILGLLTLFGMYGNYFLTNIPLIETFLPFLTLFNPSITTEFLQSEDWLSYEIIGTTIVSVGMVIVGVVFFALDSQVLHKNKLVIILTSLCILISLPEVILLLIRSIKALID